MEENKKCNQKKLGQSTNVKIGGKQYASYDMPNLKLKSKEINNITDIEKAPRDSRKIIENQKNAIKTSNIKSMNESSGKLNTATSLNNTVTSNTKSGSSINSSKTKVYTIKSSEMVQQAQQSVQRKSAIIVTSQSVIRNSQFKKIHKNTTDNKYLPKELFTNTNSKAPINSEKTKINISKNISRSSETEEQTKQSIQRQSSITFTPQTIISRPQVKISRGYYISGINSSSITKAKNKIQNSLDTQDDSGTRTLSNALTAGGVAIKAFKTAQHVSPYIVKGAVGTYHEIDKGIKVIKRIDSTVGMIKTKVIKLDRDTAGKIKNKMLNKVNQIEPIKTLNHAITRVKTGVDKVKTYSITFKNGVNKTVILTKGVVSGTVKVHITKETLQKLRNTTIRTTIKGVKLSGNVVGYAVKKNIGRSVKVGINIGKGFNQGLSKVGDICTNTGDTGTQALGYGIKTSYYVIRSAAYTPKLAKNAYKGVKTSINTVVKTGRVIGKSYQGIKTGVKLSQKMGYKKVLKNYAKHWNSSLRGKVAKTLVKAGNSIITAMIDGIKNLGMKAILPLILILLVVMCGSSVISSFGTAAASIFSPFLSDENGVEIDETAWLTSHITTKRNELIQHIKDTYNNNLVENGGQYHYVRFYNITNSEEIELTDTNINTSIYTVLEYQQYIQPIFHTIIMSEFEMQASEFEMQSVLNDIWERITTIKTEVLPTEYCNNGGMENDNLIHADIAICPNYSAIKYHEKDTESALCSCDHWYYTCKGEEGNLNCGKSEHSHSASCYTVIKGVKVKTCGERNHSHSDWKSAGNSGCYSTTYHKGELASDCGNSKKKKGCNGYYVCKGHKILSLTIELGSLDDLLSHYYLIEINSLEAKTNRTIDEERKLQNLKDYYEICVNYMVVLEEEIGLGDGNGGGGGTIVDLDGVTLTEITDYACQFIGNPYVWGGNDPHTGADCSGFVKYVYAHFGVSMPRTAREQSSCGLMIPTISQAQAGDLLFFSKNGMESGVNHVAMYLGNGKMVHASNSKPYPQGGIKVSNVYANIYKIKRLAR